MSLPRSSRFVILLALAAGLIALPACASRSPAAAPPGLAAPTKPPDRPLTSATSAPSATPFPTETQQPSPTPPVMRSATLAPSPAPSASPTPDAVLAQVKVAGLAWYDNYDMLLSFDFPGPVDPSSYQVTLADKPFKCEVLPQYPRRLYCRGQGGKVLAVAAARIYPAGSDVAGFEKDLWIPYFDNKY